MLWQAVSASGRRSWYHVVRWLWVPAFAGTTAEPERKSRLPVLPAKPTRGDHDEIPDSGRDPGCRAGCAGAGAGSDLQSGLLRAVLSERQLPEQGTGQSVYRRLSSRRLAQRLCRNGSPRLAPPPSPLPRVLNFSPRPTPTAVTRPLGRRPRNP